MVSLILSILSAVLAIYTLLCFIDIIMSWFPGAKFTKFGKIISSICDPYLTFFSRWGWLRIGNIDFSPIVSIGLLSLASSILGGITTTGRIYFGGILATVLSMLWQICSSLLSLILILMIIRWIVLLVKHGQTPYNSAWVNFDNFLSKISYKIASSIIRKDLTYQKSLLISIITLILIFIVGRFLIGVLSAYCLKIPF